jgi:hypothetical protein
MTNIPCFLPASAPQVTRLAILMMIYNELLQVDLESHSQLEGVRSDAIELVADTEAGEMAGYQWSLSVSAVECVEDWCRARAHPRFPMVAANSQD